MKIIIIFLLMITFTWIIVYRINWWLIDFRFRKQSQKEWREHLNSINVSARDKEESQ